MNQWLIAWRGCVTALGDRDRFVANPVVAVGAEVDGAGNLDDVVLHRRTPLHRYEQVKYAVDAKTPVNTEYLEFLLIEALHPGSREAGRRGSAEFRLSPIATEGS